jgi:hypothetical protein
VSAPPASGALAWGGPIGWAVDRIAGFVSDVATEGFEAIIGGLVAWVVDAVVWVVAGIFNYFIDATDPNVQADWFAGADGPYMRCRPHRATRRAWPGHRCGSSGGS